MGSSNAVARTALRTSMLRQRHAVVVRRRRGVAPAARPGLSGGPSEPVPPCPMHRGLPSSEETRS